MRPREEIELLRKLYEEKVQASEANSASLRNNVQFLNAQLAEYREKESYILSAMTGAQRSSEAKLRETEQTVLAMKAEAQAVRDAADAYAQETCEKARAAAEEIRDGVIAAAERNLADAREEAETYRAAVRALRESVDTLKASVREECGVMEAKLEQLGLELSDEGALMQRLGSIPGAGNLGSRETEESASEVMQNIYRLAGADDLEERVWTVDEVVGRNEAEITADIDALIDNMLSQEPDGEFHS